MEKEKMKDPEDLFWNHGYFLTQMKGSCSKDLQKNETGFLITKVCRRIFCYLIYINRDTIPTDLSAKINPGRKRQLDKYTAGLKSDLFMKRY